MNHPSLFNYFITNNILKPILTKILFKKCALCTI